jgi:hypothetical protein
MTVSSFVGVHDNIEFWRSTATTHLRRCFRIYSIFNQGI